MKIEVREYQAADALEIIKGQAKQPGAAPDAQLAQAKEQNGPAATLTCGGRIIGCGGLVICWPGMAEAWCLFVEDVNSYPMLPRTAKRILRQWVDEHKLVRIQAPLRGDFPDGLRFAKWLGFKREGRLRKYHPDGTDALMHSIIIER